MKISVLVIASALVLGCGSAEEAPAPVAPVPTAEAPVVVPPTGAPSADPAPSAPAAPVVPQTFEQLVASTTPIVPAPAPQSDGPISLTAEVCTLDGPPIIGNDSFRSIGPVAWATDGTLYLIDNDKRVRHYTVAAGDACALTMDTTFGENGRLTLGTGMSDSPETIVADAHGHVFVASSMGGTSRITGTTVDYHCDSRGHVSVAPNGEDGIALWSTGPAQRLHFTDEGCTSEPWAATDVFPFLDSVSFLDATHVLVGGHVEQTGAHQARVHRLDGRPDGAVFGAAETGASGDDHFCFVHQAFMAGDHLVVHDGNCRALRFFDSHHASLGSLDITPLAGVRYAWFPGISDVRDGVAYTTLNQQRGTVYPYPDVYDTFVIRIRGL